MLKFCPICKHHTVYFPYGIKTKYEIIGGGRRKGSKCLWCGHLERERLLYLYLSNYGVNGRVLWISPENSLRKLIKTDYEVDYGKDNFDVQNINCEDNFFDTVICNHVFEHVENDIRGMKEVYRVLRPGGEAIMQVPVFRDGRETICGINMTFNERCKLFGYGTHLRVYGPDYVHRLVLAGFNVEVFDFTTVISSFGGIKNRFGLNFDEKIYIGYK